MKRSTTAVQTSLHTYPISVHFSFFFYFSLIWHLQPTYRVTRTHTHPHTHTHIHSEPPFCSSIHFLRSAIVSGLRYSKQQKKTTTTTTTSVCMCVCVCVCVCNAFVRRSLLSCGPWNKGTLGFSRFRLVFSCRYSIKINTALMSH